MATSSTTTALHASYVDKVMTQQHLYYNHHHQQQQHEHTNQHEQAAKAMMALSHQCQPDYHGGQHAADQAAAQQQQHSIYNNNNNNSNNNHLTTSTANQHHYHYLPEYHQSISYNHQQHQSAAYGTINNNAAGQPVYNQQIGASSANWFATTSSNAPDHSAAAYQAAAAVAASHHAYQDDNNHHHQHLGNHIAHNNSNSNNNNNNLSHYQHNNYVTSSSSASSSSSAANIAPQQNTVADMNTNHHQPQQQQHTAEQQITSNNNSHYTATCTTDSKPNCTNSTGGRDIHANYATALAAASTAGAANNNNNNSNDNNTNTVSNNNKSTCLSPASSYNNFSYDRNLQLDQKLTVLTDLNNYNASCAPSNHHHIISNHYSIADQSINVASNNPQQSTYDQCNRESKYLLQIQSSTRDHPHQPTYHNQDNYNESNNQAQFCDQSNQYSNSDTNNVTTATKYQEEKSLINVIRTAKNKKRKLTTDKSATTQKKDKNQEGQDYTQSLITQHHQYYQANNSNSTSRLLDVGGAYSPSLSISDGLTSSAITTTDARGLTGNNGNDDAADVKGSANSKNKQQPVSTTSIAISTNTEEAQLRIIEMRKEKSRDAARSRRGKENHEFYELAKLLPLPAAITSQLDFLDKASIIRLTISFLKLRQFSVNGHPPWSTSFTTLASVNPYSDINSGLNRSSSSASSSASLLNSGVHHNHTISTMPSSSSSAAAAPINPAANVDYNITSSYQLQQQNSISNSLHCALNPLITDPAIGAILSPKLYAKSAADLFELHQGTHMLHSLDGFAFAIGRDGRFLYISETVSMYLGLSQVEMTGSSVFDYTHHQDHQELANQLGIPFPPNRLGSTAAQSFSPLPTASLQSPCSLASNDTSIEDHVNPPRNQKRAGQTLKMSSSSGKTSHHARHNNSSLGKRGPNASRSHNRSTGKRNQQQTKLDDNTTEAASSAAATASSKLPPLSSCSKEPLANPCQPAQGTVADPLVRQFCIRMKSTLTKRGCQHFKSSGYRVVHVVSHLRTYQSNDHGHLMDPYDEVDESSETEASTNATKQQQKNGSKHGKAKKTVMINDDDQSNINNDSDEDNDNEEDNDDCQGKDTKAAISSDNNNQTNQHDPKKVLIDKNNKKIDPSSKGINVTKPPKIIGMVAVAIALPPPSINELRLEADTFVLRLSLDLKITHAEAKVFEVLHHPVDQLTGRSLYSLVHPGDLSQVQKCHQDLMQKGQMMSGYYRLMGKSGGYIWVQTCATLICNNSMSGVLGPAGMTAHSPMAGSAAPLESARGSAFESLSSSFSSHINPKMSPSTTSHFSSNFDQQEQDQCIIFVNYMISNLTNESDIIDICQSADYAPHHHNRTLQQYNSGSSSINSTTTTGPGCQQQQLSVPISPSSCSSPLTGTTTLYGANQQQQRTTLMTNSPSYATSTPSAASTPTTSSVTSKHGIDRGTANNSGNNLSDRSALAGTRTRQSSAKKDRANNGRASLSSSQHQLSEQHQLNNQDNMDMMKTGDTGAKSSISQDYTGYNDVRLTNLDATTAATTGNHLYTQQELTGSSFSSLPTYGHQSGLNYSNNTHNLHQHNQQASSTSSSSNNGNNNTSVCDNNNLISSAAHLYNSSSSLDNSVSNDNNTDDGMQHRHHQQQQQDHQNDNDVTATYSNGSYKRRRYSNVSPLLRPWRETSVVSNPISTSLSQLTAVHHSATMDTDINHHPVSSYLTMPIHSSSIEGATATAPAPITSVDPHQLHHHQQQQQQQQHQHMAHNQTGYNNSNTMLSNAYSTANTNHKGARDQSVYQGTTGSASSSASSAVLLRHMSGVLAQTVRQQDISETPAATSYLGGVDHHHQSLATHGHHYHNQTVDGSSAHHHHHHMASNSHAAYLSASGHAATGSGSATSGGSNAYYHSLVDPYHHHHHLYKNGALHHHHQSQAAAVAAAAAAAAALAVNGQASMNSSVANNSAATNLNHHHHHSSVMHHHQPHYNHSYN